MNRRPGHQRGIGGGPFPGQRERDQARVAGGRFDRVAVPPVDPVDEGERAGRLHRPAPHVDRLGEQPGDDRHGMDAGDTVRAPGARSPTARGRPACGAPQPRRRPGGRGRRPGGARRAWRRGRPRDSTAAPSLRSPRPRRRGRPRTGPVRRGHRRGTGRRPRPAAARWVRRPDCFAPRRQPNGHEPHASQPIALRRVGPASQPEARRTADEGRILRRKRGRLGDRQVGRDRCVVGIGLRPRRSRRSRGPGPSRRGRRPAPRSRSSS